MIQIQNLLMLLAFVIYKTLIGPVKLTVYLQKNHSDFYLISRLILFSPSFLRLDQHQNLNPKNLTLNINLPNKNMWMPVNKFFTQSMNDVTKTKLTILFENS